MRLKKILQEIVDDYDNKRYDEEGDNFDLQEWGDVLRKDYVILEKVK